MKNITTRVIATDTLCLVEDIIIVCNTEITNFGIIEQVHKSCGTQEGGVVGCFTGFTHEY